MGTGGCREPSTHHVEESRLRLGDQLDEDLPELLLGRHGGIVFVERSGGRAAGGRRPAVSGAARASAHPVEDGAVESPLLFAACVLLVGWWHASMAALSLSDAVRAEGQSRPAARTRGERCAMLVFALRLRSSCDATAYGCFVLIGTWSLFECVCVVCVLADRVSGRARKMIKWAATAAAARSLPPPSARSTGGPRSLARARARAEAPSSHALPVPRAQGALRDPR